MMDSQSLIPEDENEDLFEHYRFEVDAGQTPLRIDKYLTDRIQNASRNKIQSAIAEGFIQVNGAEIKSNYKVRPNDLVVISLPHPPRDAELRAENIPLEIIYEDSDLVVINKSAGMVVHPAHQNWSGTLVNALAYYFNNLPDSVTGTRPGLVHRIDKETSGLLVIAKNEDALTRLAGQFYHHTIERSYQALVWGVPAQTTGIIKANIGRNPKDRRVMTVFPLGDSGKEAITHYRLLKDLRYVSLLECTLETGRTHQIRTHMKYIGHPVFNDSTYGGDKILKGSVFSKYKSFVDNCFKILPRQALHACTLGFKHPTTGAPMRFESPLPRDFASAVEKWENYVSYN